MEENNQKFNREILLYLITQSDFGGAQRYVFDLSSNFSKKYDIIVAGGQQGDAGELAQKLKGEGIKYIYIPHLKRAISPVHDWLAFRQIVKLIKKERPNIIHLNSSKISILGSFVAWWCKVPKVIYTAHGWVFNEDLPWWKKYFYKILEKFTARFKDKIICLSEFEKRNTLEQKIAPAEKITVIYNGLAPINFLPREQARKKLSEFTNTIISDETILIGSIGNLYKNKGYTYLIDSFNKSLVIRYSLFVTIIGSGPECEKLKVKSEKLKIDDRLLFAGSISNAAQLLSAFDVYVCSSIKEGLPYTILETMRAGLPIVSTNVGAIPEVINNNKNGLLVEPKNPEALAEKIKYLIDNPGIAKQLGENAKEKAKEFSLKQMIKKTEEIYKI